MQDVITVDQLPPYGFVSNVERDGADKLPAFFAGNAAAYQAFVDDLVRELAENLWPSYENAWVGAARSHAVELTRLDLGLCVQLSARLVERVDPNTATSPTHFDLYKQEDGAVRVCQGGKISALPWGSSLYRYDAALARADCDALGTHFDGSVVAQVGGLMMALKGRMQRPRPSQAALLLGLQDFAFQGAETAATPSLVSGHSLQAAVGGCHMFHLHRQGLLQPVPLLDVWSRYVVDLGDRRVLAGLHYPSDAIASWFCAMRAATLFYGPHARDFLQAAITNHSMVYTAVEASAASGTPYEPILKWLWR